MKESTLVPREEMSDLDWLARNVHVWPAGDHQPWCYVYWKGGQRAVSGNCITVIQPCVRVEMSDWLARRAELQNKPSWEDHPDAKCFVQNSCGHWWKNTETSKVEPSGEYWRVHDSVVLRRASTAWVELNKGELLGDWRDTLERRPETNEMPSHGNQPKPSTDIPECAEVKQFEPFASVEDAKITIMQGDGDVKHFGGIIGRSLPLEEDAATAKQQAPKGSGNPILGMVLADLTNRALEGKEKYGEPLLAHNGRNPLWDAYQEALDLAMYLRQAIEEQGK